MKKLTSLLLCLIGTSYLLAQNGFVVRAKISGAENYRLFLGYSINGKAVTDTMFTVENGSYVFRGSVGEPSIAYLGVRRHPALSIKTERGIIPGPALNFFLTNEEISIEGDAATIYMAKVKGGKPNEDWNKIKEKESKLTHQIWTAHKRSQEDETLRKDSASFKKLQAQRAQWTQESASLRNRFQKENPSSLVSMHFLGLNVNTLSFEDLKAAYSRLTDDYKWTSTAQRISKKIESMEATAVGKEAVPINKKDRNGNIVNLQTLKGKYVLLDFWGSWCVPCRKGHPHLKELYAKYKDQGFEILGIAQETRQLPEENRKAWLDAIKADDIPWLHVLNNEDIQLFDAVKAYGVSAFPTKILLDKEGKVLGRYIGEGGDDFDKKLKEIFGN